MDLIENEIRMALKRLLNGEPEDAQNQKHPTRITIASVAREAGCSRTLIGYNNCVYPKMRELIYRVRRRVDASKRRTQADFTEGSDEMTILKRQSLEEVNARLRERIKTLTAEAIMFATLLAEADQQLRIYSGKDQRETFDAERRARRNDRKKSGK